ncbi:DNA polymerase I [Ruminococcaceae bacterium YRB3002]|nr:DNA polymerase I [Ruminococcaceae bacterium YRB3002]
MGRLLLVDGNSIINRAYFAVIGRAPMTAPDGTPTGAVNGFLNSLHGVMKEYEPDKICVCFDLKAPTFRHKMSADYKANRKGMPDDLSAQMPVVKDLLDKWGIARMELEGYEADDLIGTLSRLGSEAGDTVYIFSGDHDDFQLISDSVSVILPQSGKGKDPRVLYDRAMFETTYGVKPEVFVYVKALMGDNSDNIRGVEKVGEKTAFKLIAQYGDIEGVLSHTDEMSPSLAARLNESHELLDLNIKLCTIDREVPVPYGIEATDYHGLPTDEAANDALYDELNRLALRSFIKKLGISRKGAYDPDSAVAASSSNGVDEEILEKIKAFISSDMSVVYVDDPSAVSDSLMSREMSVDFVNNKMIVVSEGDCKVYVMEPETAVKVFGRDGDVVPVAFEYKDKSKILPVPLPCVDKVFDTAVAGAVLNMAEGGKPDFTRLYETATGLMYPFREDAASRQLTMDFLMDDKAEEKEFIAAGRKAMLNLFVAQLQKKETEARGLGNLLYDIEFPLVITLDAIERTGMHVSRDMLDDLHAEYTRRLDILSAQIYEMCGKRFNINSPKQLADVLYEADGLALPHGKKGKTGVYSTGIDELNRLRQYHPVIDLIIDYRELSKLDSTYAAGLIKSIDSDGRIRTTFTQTLTNTGRLSSTEPNLQNIPVRSDEGARIRAAFTAEDGKLLVDADYSQIELRLLAALSGDKDMCDAFVHDQDVHKMTAVKVYGLRSTDEVTSKMRAAAKTVNFSIIYGISEYGLSNDLQIGFKEAADLIREYEKQFPGIMGFLNGLKADGEKKGYVETIFGRRRYLTELKSQNRNVRNFGLRAAMNTPIQGSAADIIKIAMNKVYRALLNEYPDARLVMQVHDELIVECGKGEEIGVADLLKREMESAVNLAIPLIADVGIGDNWLKAK